jgi:hypothetical protein
MQGCQDLVAVHTRDLNLIDTRPHGASVPRAVQYSAARQGTRLRVGASANVARFSVPFSGSSQAADAHQCVDAL